MEIRVECRRYRATVGARLVWRCSGGPEFGNVRCTESPLVHTLHEERLKLNVVAYSVSLVRPLTNLVLSACRSAFEQAQACLRQATTRPTVLFSSTGTRHPSQNLHGYSRSSAERNPTRSTTAIRQHPCTRSDGFGSQTCKEWRIRSGGTGQGSGVCVCRDAGGPVRPHTFEASKHGVGSE